MSEQTTEKAPSLAYIVSQYPMLSMIFIIREVVQLRARGFHIDVASINAADRSTEGLTRDEANESALTYYVKPEGAKGALQAHVDTLKENAGGYWRGLQLIFKLGGTDLKDIFYNLMYFTEALMVGRWMTKKGQTHLHAHLGAQSATVALYVKRVFGFGFSITVHGPDEFYDAPGQYLTQKVEASDFIVCISNFARSQLMKLSDYKHWHKLEVSRLGVDPEVFTPRPFEENPEVFEIICVGRLCSAKGQHILVDAIHQLIEQQRPVRLRIVGDGPDRPSLEQHVDALDLRRHIIFEGAVNQDRIRDLYSRAHAFSMPSFAEGIPVVLMESMAMEIPCVTTRITGIPELIRDGIDGILVAPSSTEELSEALGRLMDDPELRRTLGENGRKRVVEHYDLAKNVERLGDIFQRRLG
ncbi:MAG TPA: colanic acid biosynthesis glycosyltransferase WcaL [Gammaproteobacteria bacterium]|nr:colanic acid biosynthesis glycosyltransferase WcaL [Gammaproteobacteria bacterium]